MRCFKWRKPKATHKVLKIEDIEMCHGGLKVETLARKAGDLWFESQLWSVIIFSIFPDEFLLMTLILTDKYKITEK